MNKKAIRADLRALTCLDWVPRKGMEVLARSAEELRVVRGEVFYRPGDAAEHLYCVLDGAVGLSLPGSEGRYVQLAVLTRGEFFGVSALVRGWRRISRAVALQDSRVAKIRARILVSEVCGLSWEVFTALAESTLKPLFLLSIRRALFLVEKLDDRLALALWEYANRPAAKQLKGLLPVELTHEELAAVVGASRPRVSLALKRLERRGVFHRDGRQIRVDTVALKGYLERKYDFVI